MTTSIYLSNLTYLLMKAGIEPLKYMDEIPKDYLAHNSDLISIDIPSNIKSIGKYAFRNCKNLETVAISNGVTTIGYEAFKNCSSLTSVTIPNSLTSIGDEVLYGCSSLKFINYLDTKKQWHDLSKNDSLEGVPRSCIIHCADGDINVK